mmetsp:Transcript_14707/g.21918  ORF Transcript_14707/g.21918 Transcript_14707/m.21918 type:complete len:85 (+) Transcript_14707:219-473(+)
MHILRKKKGYFKLEKICTAMNVGIICSIFRSIFWCGKKASATLIPTPLDLLLFSNQGFIIHDFVEQPFFFSNVQHYSSNLPQHI